MFARFVITAVAMALAGCATTQQSASQSSQAESEPTSREQAEARHTRQGPATAADKTSPERAKQSETAAQPQTEPASQTSATAQTESGQAGSRDDAEGLPSPADATSTEDKTTASGSRSERAPGRAAVSLPPAAQTPEERRERLDAQFHESLERFDKRLAREQAELEEDAEAERTAASQRARDSGRTAGGGGREDGRRAGAPPPPPSPSQGDRETQSERTAGRGAATEHPERVPDDIPPRQDDDIVARQLREAAMNEPDPELREKLWDEYREYKASQ